MNMHMHIKHEYEPTDSRALAQVRRECVHRSLLHRATAKQGDWHMLKLHTTRHAARGTRHMAHDSPLQATISAGMIALALNYALTLSWELQSLLRILLQAIPTWHVAPDLHAKLTQHVLQIRTPHILHTRLHVPIARRCGSHVTHTCPTFHVSLGRA